MLTYMYTKLALLLTLSACGQGEELPETAAPVGTLELKGAFVGRQKEVGRAMTILSKHYGHDVHAALAPINVVIDGTQENIVCGKLTTNVAGCSYLSDMANISISLFMLPGDVPEETSLIHELGHTARKFIEGDSDSAHADKTFWSMIGGAEVEFEKSKGEQ